RFNLSVLAPIAAEGMIFASPVPSTATVEPLSTGGVSAVQPAALPVSAVYRGSVTGLYYDGDGRAVVTVQHPNDFVSVYSGLDDVFVVKGAKVAASQRIGHTSAGRPLVFELWHNGALLAPGDYVAF
ncbi:MAG: M23 family metallopeptidase, partial [Muribaculaceae bacterium]|nr:M23 family metallopeptidase [Muribaculaceae bacterium]